MRIVNNIIDIEDRLLLSEYLLSLGYKCGTCEKEVSISEEISEELIAELTNMTPEQLKSIDYVQDKERSLVRDQRNEKLKECDFIVLPDADVDPDCLSAFVIYRQQLRDLLNEENFDPFNFEWPEKPEYVKAQEEV